VVRTSWFVLSGLVLAALCLGASAADEAGLYSRQATWQATLRASWANLQALEDAERAAAPNVDENGVTLGPWYAIGPFDNTEGRGFAEAYPPETELLLDKTYPGAEDTQAGWARMDRFVDGQINDLRSLYPKPDPGIAYLYRVITAERAVEIRGYFGSDDGLAVWLNGEKLVSQDVPRGPGPDQDQAPLKLHQGENHLLLKIANRLGGWAFYFHTKPGGGQPEENPEHLRRLAAIWSQVRADFASPTDQQQMDAETNDGIWPTAWRPDDVGGLVSRYAAATDASLVSARACAQGLTTDLGEEQTVGAAGAIEWAASERAGVTDADPDAAARAFHAARSVSAALSQWARLVSTGLAVDDLASTFGQTYANAEAHGARVQALSKTAMALLAARPVDPAGVAGLAQSVSELQRIALVDENPLLSSSRLLFLTRRPGGGFPGLPQNWQGNSSMGRTGWDTSINTLFPIREDGQVTTLFHSDSRFVGDLCLSFDASRLLFSMPAEDKGDTYQVWEMATDGGGLRMVTAASENDYDNYDACYLPNGDIMFCSTRCYQAVPCTGGDHVGLIYVMDADGGNVRQLTFDQDHSWNPTVMNDGRVVYTRWEYNDIPHYFSRMLFSMNPDGTRQAALYGSGSYFPNTTLYATPIPGADSKLVSIISGHHGNPRGGEVAILDVSQGDREAAGVAQILPERHRKVEPVIVDQYATGKWPQFVQPYPLSERYFLASCKPSPADPWGIYLVDVFDNLVPVLVQQDAALMEPIILAPRAVPPVIPKAVNYAKQDALVYLYDVYRGGGLDGVPRGTIKSLRVVEPVYRYWGNGETYSASIDGTWDVKRILGTVPVEEDGSAYFRVPANTPIIVQPLNAEGMAQQQMRSWFTAMPGEFVSCVGCHEQRRDGPPAGPADGAPSLAMQRDASDIRPWLGEARGFSFEREVQPVLDRLCVSCHAAPTVDLRGRSQPGAQAGAFSAAYQSLHPYVRRPGLESDIHPLPPREFEASTSQLVQMLRKGHAGVTLSEEDWDRLITWIDLNVPYAGGWSETAQAPPESLVVRRKELRDQDAQTRAAMAEAGR